MSLLTRVAVPFCREAIVTDATSVTAAHSYTCALRTGGAAWCWGINSAGGLGDGTTTQRLAPTAVTGSVNAWRSTVAAVAF